MHHGIGSDFFEGRGDLLRLLQVAENEARAGIDRFAVPFGEVVEHGDFVSLIEHLLHANAADVAGAAGDENLHTLVLLC